MTIYYRADSDGVQHQLWRQRQMSSCAIASIWMARNRALQMTMAEGEWSIARRNYGRIAESLPANQTASMAPSGPMSLDPSQHGNNQNTFGNWLSNFGTFAGQVATILRADGLKTTHKVCSNAGPITLRPNWLADDKPAIVLLGWYARGWNGTRNGGHFIVAARKNRSGRIVFLDPWDAQIYEQANNSRYQGNGLIEEVIYVSRR